MKKLVGILIVLFSISAYAQIYVKQESNGDIIYSDMPTANAKAINLPEEKPPILATTEETAKEVKKPSAEDAKLTYKTFRITSPVDQQTIQNQPALLVNLNVEPDLQDSDKIQLFIDGKRIGEPSAGKQINAGLVERGSHEVYGLIIDKNKKNVMQSNVITIFVQQAHTGAPKAVQTAPKKISKLIPALKEFLASNR